MRHFYIGLDDPSQSWPFRCAMISANRLRNRSRTFKVNAWIMDSAAFTELSRHGAYRHEPEEYAVLVNRWAGCGSLQAAVTQDYMCEEFILSKTGLTIEAHQELTIERYLKIRALTATYIMPVLQGYTPEDYLRHIEMYGDLLRPQQWTGVGSVCKRNGNPDAIEDVLSAINQVRPDLHLHGFGIKMTALERPTVRELLHSADSMAWSFAGMHERRRGKATQHDPRRALEYAAEIEFLIRQPSFVQPQLFNWWVS